MNTAFIVGLGVLLAGGLLGGPIARLSSNPWRIREWAIALIIVACPILIYGAIISDGSTILKVLLVASVTGLLAVCAWTIRRVSQQDGGLEAGRGHND